MTQEILQMLLSLRWGDYPGLTGWVQCSHKSPFKEKGNHGNREEMLFEDEGRSYEPRNAGSQSPEAKKDRKWILPRASRKNDALPTYFQLLTSRKVRE